jgi:RNA polymerase sigma-70 factor (ECF subfamily)
MPDVLTPPGRSVQVDAQLLGRLRRGDRAAFETVVRAYHPTVFRFAARMLDDPEAAGDVAQQAFLQLHRLHARVDPQRGVLSWLFTVTQNLCLTCLRRRRTEAQAARHLAPRPPPDPANQVALGEAIRSALNALPPDQRAAVILREHHGLTHDEIAHVLGCSPGAARVKAHRARERLKELLADALD